MKNKKLLFLFFGIFIFMIIPKNVFATVNSVAYYDSNYTLISSVSGNCNTTNINSPRSNVRYIRFNLSDTLSANTQYSFIGNVSLSSLGDYAWVYWSTGNSGINYNGGYVIQAPSSARTVNQSVVIGPPSLYGKSSTFMFNFTTSSSNQSLPTFFQLDLNSARSMVSACLDEYQFSGGSSQQSSNQDIINNNNYNTSSIINNDNNNTQNIINNQNQNTDKQIESQKVCSYIDKNSIKDSNKFLNSSGALQGSYEFGVTDYISVNERADLTVASPFTSGISSGTFLCFYNVNKTLISCTSSGTYNTADMSVSIPSGASFFRASIQQQLNRPTFKICKNGNQALSDGIGDLNNNITNDNTDGATANANANIEGFEIDSHGLGDIFNTIVTFIANVANSTCTALTFTLPFVHNEVTLPCMSGIYTTHFPTFFTLYQLITTGLIAYRVIINLFQKVKQLSDPNYDKIEVIQL